MISLCCRGNRIYYRIRNCKHVYYLPIQGRRLGRGSGGSSPNKHVGISLIFPMFLFSDFLLFFFPPFSPMLLFSFSPFPFSSSPCSSFYSFPLFLLFPFFSFPYYSFLLFSFYSFLLLPFSSFPHFGFLTNVLSPTNIRRQMTPLYLLNVYQDTFYCYVIYRA